MKMSLHSTAHRPCAKHSMISYTCIPQPELEEIDLARKGRLRPQAPPGPAAPDWLEGQTWLD